VRPFPDRNSAIGRVNNPPLREAGACAALAHALDLARPAVPRLELAVDDRNHPARRLYDAAGFVPFDR
jgi:RimJ/RimL family protein N-acetyltransferase